MLPTIHHRTQVDGAVTNILQHEFPTVATAIQSYQGHYWGTGKVNIIPGTVLKYLVAVSTLGVSRGNVIFRTKRGVYTRANAWFLGLSWVLITACIISPPGNSSFSPNHLRLVGLLDRGTIAGVHSNQDLIWCAKTGVYMGFGSSVGPDYCGPQ